MNRFITIALAAVAASGAGASGAEAATTCSLANGVLEVRVNSDDSTVAVKADFDGMIAVSPAGACAGGTPTVANTGTVVVVDESDDLRTSTPSDGDTTLEIVAADLFRRSSPPEADGTNEVEFAADMRGGDDALIAYTSSAPAGARLPAGAGGHSWTRAGDADMAGMPFDEVRLEGHLGNDVLSARGGRGTGAPLPALTSVAIDGASGDDAIAGSDGPNTIQGESGDDAISAGFGSDRIDGGPGADTIDAGDGVDLIQPGAGNDVAQGGSGYDAIAFTGDTGVTIDLARTEAQDTREGTDTLGGFEAVHGTDLPDDLAGTAGEDHLFGSGGDDRLDGRGGPDRLDGGDDADTVSYARASGPVTVDLGRSARQPGGEELSDVEHLVGSAFADVLTGDALANRIAGGAGPDTIAAGDGADRVEVRDGQGDRVACGAGEDSATADRRSLDALAADCETVDALPEPQPGGGGAGQDRTPPVLGPVTLTRTRFAVGRGTRVGYGLSEPATVTLRVQRVGARKPAGTLRRTGRAGANRVGFSGRIGRRALRPGRYRLTVHALDTAGNRSATRVARFRIVR